MIPNSQTTQSPCNKICTLDAEGVCVGCGRSRSEIGGWSQFSDAEKERVVARAKARLVKISGRIAPAKEKA